MSCLFDFLYLPNCATYDFLSTSTQKGTREQAYVYAMSAAALAWSIARACAAGSLAACSCAAPPRAPPRPPRQAQVTPAEPHARFKWGGCGDNYQWAERFDQYAFIPEVPKDIKTDFVSKLREIRNNIVGVFRNIFQQNIFLFQNIFVLFEIPF